MSLGGMTALVWKLAKLICPLCAHGVGHHTNSATSIGGADRHHIWDVHAVEDASGVGLRECEAGDLLLLADRKGWLA